MAIKHAKNQAVDLGSDDKKMKMIIIIEEYRIKRNITNCLNLDSLDERII